MSYLTEVTIWHSINGAEKHIEDFNARLPMSGRDENLVTGVRPFINKDEAGGSKFYCGHMFGAMFNYISYEGLLKAFYETDWEHAHVVMIVDCEGDEDGPMVYMSRAREGHLDESLRNQQK